MNQESDGGIEYIRCNMCEQLSRVNDADTACFEHARIGYYRHSVTFEGRINNARQAFREFVKQFLRLKK